MVAREDWFFVYFLSLEQRLGPLGYCAPPPSGIEQLFTLIPISVSFVSSKAMLSLSMFFFNLMSEDPSWNMTFSSGMTSDVGLKLWPRWWSDNWQSRQVNWSQPSQKNCSFSL